VAERQRGAVKAIRLLNENLGTQISEKAGIGIKPITEFGTKRCAQGDSLCARQGP